MKSVWIKFSPSYPPRCVGCCPSSKDFIKYVPASEYNKLRKALRSVCDLRTALDESAACCGMRWSGKRWVKKGNKI